MLRKISIPLVCLVLIVCFLSGCTRVIVIKPDKTRIEVDAIGSTQVKDFAYLHDSNSLQLRVGAAYQTPAGISGVVTAGGVAVGKALVGHALP